MISLENSWRSLDWCHIPNYQTLTVNPATESRWNFCCKAAALTMSIFSLVFFSLAKCFKWQKKRGWENWQLSWNGCFVVTQHCEEKNMKYCWCLSKNTTCHILSPLITTFNLETHLERCLMIMKLCQLHRLHRNRLGRDTIEVLTE